MEFDLHEIRSEILEKYPEWIDLMNAVEFRNSSGTDSAGHSGNRILYNSFRLRQLSREAQKFLIAGQLMHIQLAHGQRGENRDPELWDAAC